MNNLDLTNSLSDISLAIKNRFEGTFEEKLESNLVNHKDDLAKMIDYYNRSERSEPNIIKKIAKDAIIQMFSYLPDNFIKTTLENIDVDISKKRANHKFTVGFPAFERVLFVKFKFIIAGAPLVSEDIKFRISISGVFNDLEVISNVSKEKGLKLGKLQAVFALSLTKIPFVPVEYDISLFENPFSLGLSRFVIPIKT